MKVAFSTLGCRVNLYETEAMTEIFIREGYEVVDFESFADVYVINTCTVTNMSDKKSRQMISRARRINEDAIIAVVGCYAQISPEKVAALEGVNVVLGTRNKGEIVYWVNRAKAEGRQIVKIEEVLKNNVFEELKIEEYRDKTRAFLKIQDGCNRFCSYCAIPFARGAVCSKKPSKVLEEIKTLSQNGFKEVILSGIHTASYGIDFKEDLKSYGLIELLEDIDKIEGIERVRIGSLDPTFFTEEIVQRIKGLKKLCPHFHLSLQSGCDETLKRMNRHYTAEEYRNVVKSLRENLSDVSVTTDVIVGFPEESDKEFQKTYEFLKSIKLTKTHIFKYSPREGTKAAIMKNQVDGNKKDERSKKLEELNKINEKSFMEKFKNTETYVLFEESSNLIENGYTGYTENYIKVVVSSEKPLNDKLLKVRLNDVKDEFIIGEIL